MSEREEFGSISEGTMRKEDLIPAFLDELERIDGGENKEFCQDIRKLIEEKGNAYYESEDSDYDLEELFDCLDNYAPRYGYFGAHPGDGALYGFWLIEDLKENFEGLTVKDLNDVPKNHTGEVCLIDQNGNVQALYDVEKGNLKEVWIL